MWSEKRRDEEESGQRGFTLVETAVALGVFVITLIPTTSVFWGGIQAASVSSIRSDAVGVAASTLADVQALPYNEVGFYGPFTVNGTPNPGQSNYVSSCPSSVPACSGEPTVNLVNSGTFQNAIPTGAFAPVTTQTVGATTFTVTTYITWANAAVPSGTCVAGSLLCVGAYPQVTVVVSWGGPAAGSVTESSIYYPGGQGKYTGSQALRGATSTCPSNPGKPSDLWAADSNTSSESQQAQVTVSWQPVSTANEPCYYVIDEATSASGLPSSCTIPTGSGFQANYWQPGTAASYTVTGLSWNTQYWFAVVAYSSGGANCQFATFGPVTTPTASTGPSCTVTAFTVTAVPSNSTSKTYEDTHGNMTDNLNLVASTTGTCSTVTVQAQVVNSSTQDPGSPYSLAAGTSGQFTYSVPASGTAWITGQHIFTVSVGGVSASLQQSMEVCAHAGSGQKTNSGTSCP